MKIGVLGTGQVGRTLAARLVELGHDVVLGAREATNPRATEWVESMGGRARAGTFADAAAHGEVVVNATAGAVSLRAIELAGPQNLAGRVLIDVANALDSSTGTLTLTVANTDSLAEQLQRALPETRVVKTLNTVNAAVMVEPARLQGDHVIFLAGDDTDAKAVARSLLEEFGWPAESVIDLGGIIAARGMEMYLPLWVAVMNALGTAEFNVGLIRPR